MLPATATLLIPLGFFNTAGSSEGVRGKTCAGDLVRSVRRSRPRSHTNRYEQVRRRGFPSDIAVLQTPPLELLVGHLMRMPRDGEKVDSPLRCQGVEVAAVVLKRPHFMVQADDFEVRYVIA